jgi:acetylornithine deacetylase/succinyl-diaminopimelate desuccinylase-like protein
MIYISFHNLMKYFALTSIIAVFLLLYSNGIQAQTSALTSFQQLGRSIFKELIEINTTYSTGSTTVAANAMSKRLKAAGFSDKEIIITGPGKNDKNLIVKMKGTGQKQPILLLAHLDVVEARREDWSFDPFKFLEQDGFFYGRGTIDIKDGAAILVACFIRMKQEHFIPDRDLILALTSGEESDPEFNGVEWLLKNHRSMIEAEFCINMDAGDPHIIKGKRMYRTVSASEKGYLNFNLEVKNSGGHSGIPVKENAIYRLAEGLIKLSKYDFPVHLDEVTKSYFEKMSLIETGQLATDMKTIASNPKDSAAIQRLSTTPYYNALMRTTCVVTMLQAGHAENALPQTANAVINCRVLPGVSEKEIKKIITEVLDDSLILVSTLTSLGNNPASPLKPEVMKIIENVTYKMWPGIPIIPIMEYGGTDGSSLRSVGISTYGISGVFIDIEDIRAHGKDERVGVKEFYDGLEYEYQLIKSFSVMY